MKTGLTYHLNTLLSVLFLSGFLTYYVGQHPRHVGQREEPVQGHVLHFNPEVQTTWKKGFLCLDK